MKYTKDNIVGLYFTCMGSSWEFKINKIEGNDVEITWGESSRTYYSLGDVLKFLDDGTWKVINQKLTYDVY